MRALISKVVLASAVACGFAAAVSCGDDGGGASDGGIRDEAVDPGTVGCLETEMIPVACPPARVTFEQVQPIFQSNCVNACHNGVTPDPLSPGSTLWPLKEKDHILEWANSIVAWVGDCSMPPQDAGVPMTKEQRRAIIEFVRCERPPPTGR